MKTQTIYLDTIIGQSKIKAPVPWEFDKTSTIVWATLLDHTRKRVREHISTVRAEHVLSGQIAVLANVLSNALGKAPPYWIKCAIEIVSEGG